MALNSCAQPPIIFEIDSDHNRAMLELAKRPYADRLKECNAARAHAGRAEARR